MISLTLQLLHPTIVSKRSRKLESSMGMPWSAYCCIALLAAALLIALGFTPVALTAGGTTVMGRGGQLEKPLLW